jgi:hypothetical protein
MDLIRKSLSHQVRQVAAMVDVGMREDDRVDGVSGKGEVQVSFVRFLSPTLIKTAVQQQSVLVQVK